jgi:hypothetical protein
MAQHSFTLELQGIDTANGGYEDALFEAGCGDALVAVVEGRLMVDFDRDDLSYERAVASAVRDVERAGARVVNVMRMAE